MAEKVSNNKSTSSNGKATEKKEGFFAKITKQLDREMQEGRKEEIAGLKLGSNNNKKANGKKSQPAQLSGSSETKQLREGKQKSKQLPAAKTATKKTSIKSKKKTNKLITYTGVTEDGRPAWVKAMDNTKKQQEETVEASTDNTFAGQYLMPIPNNSRRKPGPSLNMFKDMARQVKAPKTAKKG